MASPMPAPIRPPIPQPKPLTHYAPDIVGWADKWTTADEVHSIEGMHERGNIYALTCYIHNARHRIWHGAGMNVDPGVVILVAQDLLEDLLKRKKKS